MRKFNTHYTVADDFKNVKVGELRDLIDSCFDSYNSSKMCLKSEKSRHLDNFHKKAKNLIFMFSNRASKHDLDERENLIEKSTKILLEN